MTVHKVTGIDGPGYADYLTCKDAPNRSGDYYLGRGGQPREGVGTWHGAACTELGLSGRVRRPDLMRVWDGRNPRSGEILVRRGATGEHVAGVDATFSAPKSVSVLWALSEKSTRVVVEAAHYEAVLAGLRHIEENVELARRRDGDAVVHERVAGIVASRFRHHTSRLTPDQYERGEAPDPQLHDHVVIANMALRLQPDSDGNRWAAIDSRALYRVAAEAGAVYRAELAMRLQRMGYGITRDGRYFEIDGIGVALRERFSARSGELAAAVRAFREEHGRPPTPSERKALTLMTRIQKSVEHAPAFEQWQRRSGGATLPQPVYGPPAPVDRDAVVAAVVNELSDPTSPRYLTRVAAVVDDRTVRTAIAEAAQGRIGGGEVAWLIDQVQASPQLHRLDDQHWTTETTLQLEREVMATAHRLAERALQAPNHVILEALAGARVPLSADQKAAVHQLVASQFGLLTAPAGTGKGEVLRAVAEVRRGTGYQVIALAAAGETAQRFGREIGAHQAMTVDGFLKRVQRGRVHVTGRTAVLVDEAGLLEDWRWAALMRAAGDAALTVAGDPRQLSPIEAGGLYPLMTRELGATTLRENFRARDEWAKDAWNELREGKALQAVARLERKRRITISLTRAQSREAAVERWDQDRREGALRGRGIEQYLLLTDTSNTDVDLLNAAAQDRRVRAGELSGPWVEVAAARDDGGTRRERFYADDRVSFTRQVYFGRWQPRVENGATGVVTRVDEVADAVDVQLPDRLVTIRGDQLPALRLGYAHHVYRGQGKTVDRIYGVTGGWQTARESSYVGISRAREASFVYTDFSSLDMETHERKAALRELVARAAESRAKVSALGWMQHPAEAHTRRSADRIATTRPTSPAESEAARRTAMHEAERQRAARDQRREWETQRE